MNCSTETIEFLSRESTCIVFLLLGVIVMYLLTWNYMRLCEKALKEVEKNWNKFSESKNELILMQAQFLCELICFFKKKNSDETEETETEETKNGE